MSATTTTTEQPQVEQQDPNVELAKAATAIARAAGLTSRYSKGEAAGLREHVEITKGQRGKLTLKRSGSEWTVTTAALKKFVANEAKDDEDVKTAAKAMKDISIGLPGMMYGRKTAIFILAAVK